ncbi:Nuclear factor of kappa light polypeptide protein enhancer in B-cells inhibitor-like 1 [Chamberlinius hualienensis]
MGFNSRKFLRYVKYDRLDKVKRYIKSYGITIINLPLDHKKRTAIHVACKYRSSYSLNHFLQYECNLKATDTNGNIPLHLLLDKLKVSAKEYKDMVQPLILRCSYNTLDIPNKKGTTARELLKLLKCEEFSSYEEYLETMNIPTTSYASEDVSISDDADWYEKLSYLVGEDYEQDMGKFERDESTEGERKETYYEWTNRIAEEYHKKQQNKSDFYKSKKRKHHRNEDNSSNDHTKFKELKREENLSERRNRENHKNLLNKMKFISKAKRIFCKKSNELIHFSDLPWLSYVKSEQTLLNILLADVNQSDAVLTKKTLRDYLLQWHPDKFSQLCSHRLKESEKVEVLAEVNRFSQIINSALQKFES